MQSDIAGLGPPGFQRVMLGYVQSLGPFGNLFSSPGCQR